MYEASSSPAWTVSIDGVAVKNPAIENGYVSLRREWKGGESIALNFAMPVQRVRVNEFVMGKQDRVAFKRGPVVYCFESDGEARALDRLTLPGSATILPKHDETLLGGVTVLQISSATAVEGDVSAIPYYAWNNRGLKPMAVWVRSEAWSDKNAKR